MYSACPSPWLSPLSSPPPPGCSMAFSWMTTTLWCPTCLVSWPALSDFICSGDLHPIVRPLVTSLWLCENGLKMLQKPCSSRLNKCKVLEKWLKAQVSFVYQALSLCFYCPNYSCVYVLKVPYHSSSLPLNTMAFLEETTSIYVCRLSNLSSSDWPKTFSSTCWLLLLLCVPWDCFGFTRCLSTDKANREGSGSCIPRLMDLMTFTHNVYNNQWYWNMNNFLKIIYRFFWYRATSCS